jgi:hypothetical protein
MIWARHAARMVATIANNILSGESEKERPLERTRRREIT